MARQGRTMRGALLVIPAMIAMCGNAIAEECEPAWNSFSSGGQIGLTGQVRSLAVYQGDLYIGGQIETVGGQEANHIARWDGEQWNVLESGGQVGIDGSSSAGGLSVWAMTVWQGKLVVGGSFQTAGGQEMNRIALWDGTDWSPLTSVDHSGEEFIGIGPGINRVVYALLVQGDDLVVGGFFETAGHETVNAIVRRVGSSWQPFVADDGQIGIGDIRRVHALSEWQGELVVAGGFRVTGVAPNNTTVNYITRWTGSGWGTMTSGGQIGVGGPSTSTRVRVLHKHDDSLFVAGRFDSAGGQTVNHIARWDGEQWHPLTANGINGVYNTTGSNPDIQAIVEYEGDLVVAGLFTHAGGEVVNHIARWDGESWHPFVSGEEIGMQTTVQALQIQDDTLIAGGIFNLAGGQEVRRVASWDGCRDDAVDPIFFSNFEAP